MAEVNITYETLFELLRREKTKRELQKMEGSFFKDVALYIKEKRKILEEKKYVHDLFAAEERRKAEIQHENTMKIVRELYERREKKIIELALDKSRTFNSIMDTSVLLAEEKEIYYRCVESFDKFRKEILYSVLEAKMPEVKKELNPEKKEETAEIKHQETNESKPEEKPEIMPEPINLQEGFVNLKFVNAVPKFLGTDLKEYGPFNPEDSAAVPGEIAELLIGKGDAVAPVSGCSVK